MDHGQLTAWVHPGTTLTVRSDTPVTQNEVCIKPGMLHTVASLADGSGLNIALICRGDVLDVSVCARPDNVPAVDDIANAIPHSVDILVAAAEESPRGQGRSVVSEMTSCPLNRSSGRPY